MAVSKRRTPRYNHEPVEMHKCSNQSEFEQAGDFSWDIHRNGKETLFITIALPCNALDLGDFSVAKFAVDINDENNGHLKVVEGSTWNAPHLDPTIHAPGVWHGWVRAGHLVEA